jgi:hypothetical protein
MHLYDEEQQTVFARMLGDEVVTIAFNNDSKPATIDFDVRDTGLPNRATPFTGIAPSGGAVRVESGRIKVTLPPRTAAVYVWRVGDGSETQP